MPQVVVNTRVFVDPFFQQNSRVIHVDDGPSCWIVDPGLPPATSRLLETIAREGLEPAAIVLTHAHADHIAGIPDVLQEYPQLPLYLAEEEWSFLSDPSENLSVMTGMSLRIHADERFGLPEGLELRLGGSVWRVLDTSGHSPGGRSFYCAEAAVVVVGDSLMRRSMGRVDFPHSNGPALLRNIREKLLTLPPATRVLSGHGPDTTAGEEARLNPFVGEAAGRLGPFDQGPGSS